MFLRTGFGALGDGVKCAGKYFGGETGVMEELTDAGSKSDPSERGSSKC